MKSTTMKAFGQNKYGPAHDCIEILTVEKPTPLRRDLLVKLHAVAWNPVDSRVAAGEGKLPFPLIMGWDGAGVVEATGPDAMLYKKGDEVYFSGNIQRKGCHAEYVVVDECIVGKKPNSLNWEQAAAIPLTALTAWEGLVENMGISVPDKKSGVCPNEKRSLLVVGGAGGVGSICIQIAKKVLHIGEVIATASRPETVEWCKMMGADKIINHKNNWKEELKKVNVDGVNYIFDTAAIANNYQIEIDICKPLGKIVGITTFPNVNLTTDLFQNPINMKRISLSAEMMFARPVYDFEPEEQKKILDKVSELLDEGVLKTTAHTRVPWTLEGVKEAYRLQESGKAIGKTTATVDFGTSSKSIHP